MLACLLFVRRLSGALQQPLSAWSLLTVTLVAVSVMSLLHSVASLSVRRTGLLLSSSTLTLFAVSLSLPGTQPWALLFFWAAVIGEEATWWWVSFRRLDLLDKRATSVGEAILPTEHSLDEEETELPAGVTQQLTRAWQDGREVIYGQLRSCFTSGRRDQSLHIAFCPPLSTLPEVTVHQLDGPSATVKASQVEVYGARLDIHLASAARETTEVVLEFSATQPNQPQSPPSLA